MIAPPTPSVAATTGSVLAELVGADAEVRVAQVDADLVGIAVRLDAVRCLITSVRATSGGTAIETRYATPLALHSGGPGCRPTLAR